MGLRSPVSIALAYAEQWDMSPPKKPSPELSRCQTFAYGDACLAVAIPSLCRTSATYVTIHLEATQIEKELPIGSARSALRASLGAGDQANQSWSIASAFYDSYQSRAYTQAQDGLGSTPTDERRLWQRRKNLQSPTQPGLSLPPPRPPRCCRRNAIFRSRRFYQ